MRITGYMVERAANAIRECMLNDGWKPWGVRQETMDRYIRAAAQKALEAALADVQAVDGAGTP